MGLPRPSYVLLLCMFSGRPRRGLLHVLAHLLGWRVGLLWTGAIGYGPRTADSVVPVSGLPIVWFRFHRPPFEKDGRVQFRSVRFRGGSAEWPFGQGKGHRCLLLYGALQGRVTTPPHLGLEVPARPTRKVAHSGCCQRVMCVWGYAVKVSFRCGYYPWHVLASL